MGSQASAAQKKAVALGSKASAAGERSVALGPDSYAKGRKDTALGSGARVTADNSVALGADSIADEENTVSVGSPGKERRITNVYDGMNDFDAVNVRQLEKVEAGVAANAANIARNRAAINTNRQNIAINAGNIAVNANNIAMNRADINRLDQEVDDLRDESRAGIAAAGAMADLMPGAPGKTVVNLRVAGFHDAAAAGLTFVHKLKKHPTFMLEAGASYATGDEWLYRGGVSWEFGKAGK
jgi:autotransporter adhesin